MRGTWWLAGIFGVFGLFPAVAEARKPPKQPLLVWQVEKDGAISHLIGTCHVPAPLAHTLPAPHDELLTTARVLYTEIDATGVDPMSALSALKSQDGRRLSEVLGDDDFRALVASLPAVPAPLLDRMSPVGAALMRTVSPIMAPTPEGLAPLDQQITAGFAGSPAARRYLETAEQQLAMLDSGLDGLAGLKQSTPPAPEAERLALATEALCAAGDTTLLEAALTDPTVNGGLIPMLYPRNAAWMPLLRDDLASGGALVAVGAGHMLGEGGLIALLTAEGYQVTRLVGRPEPWTPPEGAFAPHILPPPPVDRDLWSRYAAGASERMSEAICSAPNPLSACWETLPGGCRGIVAADVRACVAQSVHTYPVGAELPHESVAALSQCSVIGLPIEVMLRPEPSPEDPCAPLYTTMKAAMAAAMAR